MPASIEMIEELICNDSFCKYVLDPDRETVEYWEAFQKDNPDKAEEFEQARQFVKLLEDDNEGDNAETDERITKVWGKLQESISMDTPVRHSDKPKNIYQSFILKVAAVILFATGISFLILKLSPNQDTTTINKTENFFQRVTELGQKASFYLPDGSQVTLNAGSSLHYYESESTKIRELFLEGEAFFDVKKDAERPFIVRTKSLSTTVLGTSFNVKAYGDEEKVEVALLTGSIAISTPKFKDQILKPYEMVSYDSKKGIQKSQGFGREQIIGWKDKILAFEDVSFRELTATLSRWYGVDFVIQDSTKMRGKFMDRQDYKGKYYNKSLETVLKAISFSYDFEYEIKGKKVLIK